MPYSLSCFCATPAQSAACQSHGTAFPPLLALLSFPCSLPPREQLAGFVQRLPYPLAGLHRISGVAGEELVDRLAAIHHVHGDPAL